MFIWVCLRMGHTSKMTLLQRENADQLGKTSSTLGWGVSKYDLLYQFFSVTIAYIHGMP